MASVNKVILIGNCGRDPDMRYMPDGTAVANVSIATTFRWKDKSTGENKDETEWANVVFRARLAEIAGEYLKKGAQIYVEGRLQTRKWQDKEGHDRFTTEVVANEMQMLGSRSGAGVPSDTGHEPPAEAATAGAAPRAKTTAGADFDDDIPF